MDAAARPPFKPLQFMARAIDFERRPDGVLLIKSKVPLAPHMPHIPALFRKCADAQPENSWLAQRRGERREWQHLTYGEAKRLVDRVTQFLINSGPSAGKPVMILSGNSLEHAVVAIAAMQARMPVAPISIAYSLRDSSHAKLKAIFELLQPAVIFVQDARQYEQALRSLNLANVTLIYVDNPLAAIGGHAFADVANTSVTKDVEDSIDRIGPDTIGKILFTSGSTGIPKGAIQTQGMMSANVMMNEQAMLRSPDARSVLLDWLPWSHVAGGNAVFHSLFCDGGAMYIDDGRPIPGQFEETVRNLGEVLPTKFLSVPIGFSMLVPALERDERLAAKFFKNLELMTYAAASISEEVYNGIQDLAVKHCGYRIPFISGYGATETGPCTTSTYWLTERAGLIGLPYPGVELKLVPVDDGRFEMRTRGVGVTPGYFRRADLTAAAFDEEGYYRLGDAATFVDPDAPIEGLAFAGRITEDFKLDTGTFVRVGALRIAAIDAAAPIISDLVVAGHDKSYVAVLAWPNLQACRTLAGLPDATMEQVVASQVIRQELRAKFSEFNKSSEGSSLKIRRIMLMTAPPSVEANEITDKGYINQRATLANRQAFVDHLYASDPSDNVIVVD